MTTKYVAPSGGDYSTLESGVNANEGTLSAPMLFEIQGSWSSADTAAVTMHNYVTTAANYLSIYTDSSNRATMPYSATRYRLEVTGSEAINNAVDYSRIDSLQIKVGSASANYQEPIRMTTSLTSGNNDVRISNCVCVGHAHATYVQHGMMFSGDQMIVSVWNCVVYNVATATDSANIYLDGNGPLTVSNCTLIGSYYGVRQAYGTTNVKNTYAGGASNTDYTGTITYTTCASSDATSRTGVTANIAVSTTADSTHAGFTNISAGTEDYHIKVGSPFINVGTDLSSSFTTDIDGTTRPTGAGTWDIGADELGFGWVGITHNYPGNSVTRTNVAGNLLVVVASWGDGTSDPSLSDSAGNSWVPLAVAGSSGQRSKAWYCLSCAAYTNNVISLDSSPSDVGVTVLEISGTNITYDTGGHKDETDYSSTDAPAHSITTAHDGCIVACWASESSPPGACSSVDSPFTNRQNDTSHFDEQATNLAATAGTNTCTWHTATASAGHLTYLLAFYESTSSTPVSVPLTDDMSKYRWIVAQG